MADEPKLSKDEYLKEGSRQLRGTIGEELRSEVNHFGTDNEKLLKPHGIYQQEDRDARKAKAVDGVKTKQHIFMVRTRIPGGKVSPEQFLGHLDLCEKYGNGTLRITTRQGFQLHGVIKQNLKAAVKGINDTLLTTRAACGDVERNVVCCPAPFKNNSVRDEMQAMADRIAEHLRPRTSAYHEIWLTDDSGESVNVAEWQPVDEPIYGKTYLPRKFKTGIALPDDNCIDIYAQDLGFLAVVENDRVAGYNVLVGGSMGVTPSAAKTFVALAQRMTFVTPDEVIGIAEAVVKVQRDHGNREDRKRARMKYLIHDWGLPKFKATVEDYYGRKLPEPHPADVTAAPDHIGWYEQGDGKLFLGINIETGRIKDEGPLRIKTGLRKIVEKYRMNLRTTALQSLILCDIAPEDRHEISRILAEHGIKQAHELTMVRRLSIACPAFPTCGLSITESERIFPGVIDQLEKELARLGIPQEKIAVHMTGCPNGCARPYTPDVGFVGKAAGKYTIFLGGNVPGTRLAFNYKDMVPLDDLVPSLIPALNQYKAERHNGESFGDFCARLGKEGLPV
jgi:sulfite reductase (ferredoxin)